MQTSAETELVGADLLINPTFVGSITRSEEKTALGKPSTAVCQQVLYFCVITPALLGCLSFRTNVAAIGLWRKSV